MYSKKTTTWLNQNVNVVNKSLKKNVQISRNVEWLQPIKKIDPYSPILHLSHKPIKFREMLSVIRFRMFSVRVSRGNTHGLKYE
jgi:hypothetical protein